MISVLTPTIRKEGLPLVKKALERQDVEYEWLIGSPFDPEMGTWIKDDFEGGYWTLNRCYNKLIQNAKGDLIVSIQDHTFFNPDALEKFDFWFQQHPNYIVSGVGDKYDRVYPERGIKVWSDPRKRNTGQFRAVPFNEIEGNFCSIPKKALYDVGGFDRALDFEGFGMDFYNVLERISKLGKYEFYIDESNESYSETHGRVGNWDKNNLIHNYKLTDRVVDYL